MKFATAIRCLIASFAIGISTAALSSGIVSDSVNSTVLGRKISFTVYLPDDYQKAPGTFPVVYLLHGAGEDEYTWIRKGGVTETLDGLIHRGLLRPTIVVMPTTGPQSWWADGAKEHDETAMMTAVCGKQLQSHARSQRTGHCRTVNGRLWCVEPVVASSRKILRSRHHQPSHLRSAPAGNLCFTPGATIHGQWKIRP